MVLILTSKSEYYVFFCTDIVFFCSAQHIHRILSASRENIDEARRILPDDVKDIVLPQGS